MGKHTNNPLFLPPISAARPGPLYEQVIDGIKREISEGRLAPGAALPSFRALAEKLLVSVITVKRAYEELEREGIIFRKQGLGTFVAENGAARSRAVKRERTRALLQEALREGLEAGLSQEALIEMMRKLMQYAKPLTGIHPAPKKPVKEKSIMDTAIRISGLEKAFPKFHLGPLDLNVPRGAIYGFIGPNGAGKTTTIDLMMGMGAKDAGSITIFGLDHLEEEVAVKRQIGYVSPDLLFNAWKRVDRLIGFYRGFYPDWDDAYCTALLERLNLGWKDKIATLSYGARTKLGLIVALSHRPALLLLDEPFSGLDAIAKQQVLSELLDAVQDESRTVFISSHNLDDIERITDHLGILHHGKLLLEGSTAALIERFSMADYIGSNGTELPALPGIYPQGQSGDRRRLLLDKDAGPAQALESRGFKRVAETPVTLEELFIGLAKER